MTGRVARLTPDQLAAIAAADPAETTAALARRLGASWSAVGRARTLAAAGSPRPLRRHACPDCGAPVRAAGWRCPACQPAAIRRTDAARKARPAPVPQPDPSLPPYGAMVYDDDDGSRVQCHACGRFFGALATHVTTHGLTADGYRAEYGLKAGQSLAAPATQARLRAAALANDLGATGRDALAGVVPAGRPKGSAESLQGRVERSRRQRDAARSPRADPAD